MNRGFRRYKKVTTDSKLGVDLGLSGLINPDAGPKEAPPAEEHSGDTADEAAAPEQERNEYEKLALAGNWAELANLCEQRLADHAAAPFSIEDDEIRVWWIKSQISSGGVPAAIIAAPLDTLTRGLSDKLAAGSAADPKERKVRQIAAALLMEVASALSPDSEVWLEFIERAWRLDASHAAELKIILDEALAALPEDRRNDPQNIRTARLKRLAAELATPPEPAAREPQKKLQPTPPPFELFTVEPAPAAAAPATAPAHEEIARSETPPESHGRSLLGRILLPAAVVVLLLVMALQLTQWLTHSSESSATNSMPGMLREDKSARVLLPPVERIAGMSQLDAVFYDIQHSPRGQGSERRSYDSNSADSSSGSAAAPAGRATVNTSTPVEPPEVAQRTSRRAPRHDENRLEPEQQGRQESSSQGEDFASSRLYEVIAPTSVMSEPSVRGEVLADLKAGDKLMVEGKEGYWLRVRSRKDSKAGYVLGQDAVPGKNW